MKKLNSHKKIPLRFLDSSNSCIFHLNFKGNSFGKLLQIIRRHLLWHIRQSDRIPLASKWKPFGFHHLSLFCHLFQHNRKVELGKLRFIDNWLLGWMSVVAGSR